MAVALPRATAVLRQLTEEGVHYGAQLSVRHNGKEFDVCVGEAAPGTPIEPDHVLCWSSSVKPLAAVALAQLEERGALRLEDTVAMHLPDFAQKGKDGITLKHCLMHTAGLCTARLSGSPAEKLAQLCAQAPLWEPGTRCGYDSPAWYALAGVVGEVSRRSYEQYCEEEVFAPLGLGSCSVGMTPARSAALGSRLASIYVAPLAGARTWRPLPDDLADPCPAGNGRGPAHELAGLYASLLPGATSRVLGAAAVERITRVAREGLVDELQGVDTPWSLGFAVGSVLSGRHASRRAFGHGGSQSSWAFADPEHELAVACLCNGKPGPELHYRRVGAVSTAVYEDLGLATEGMERTFKLPNGMGTF